MSALPDEFCRLCLRVDGTVSVFTDDCQNSWNLCDRIFECVSVKISVDDVFPQSICNKCLQKVNAWCEFKTTCDRLQRTWYLWLKSVYGPKEIVKKRIRDHARKRSFELGYWKRKDYPVENNVGRNRYHKRPRRIIEDDCIVINDEEDDDESSLSTEPEDPRSSKKIRIESTHTLSLSKETVPVENGLVAQNPCITEFNEGAKAQNVEAMQTSGVEPTSMSAQGTDTEKSVPENMDSHEQTESVENVGNGSPEDSTAEDEAVEGIRTLKCLAQAVVDKDKSPAEDTLKSVETGDVLPGSSVEPENAGVESLESVVQSLEAVVDSVEARVESPPYHPKSLKTLVQAVLNAEEKADEKQQEQPEVEESATLPVEQKIWQPESLKTYTQAILDALEGKSSGPEHGPWPEEYYIRKEAAEASASDKSDDQSGPKPFRIVPMHELRSLSSENALQPNVLRSLLSDDSNSRNNEETEAPPSPPDSSQAESTANPSTPNYMDYTNHVSYVNIKEEPMSDDDNHVYQDDEYDYSVYAYSVKTEPPDFTTPMTTISTGEILNRSPSKNRRHYCNLCNKRLSNEKCYLRHLNSSIHRMISSAVSAGKQVTPEMRRTWLAKIKADSYKKSAAKAVMKKPMKPNRSSTREKVPLRRYSDESASATPQPSSSTADTLKFGNKRMLSADEIVIRDAPKAPLRECTVCNMTFQSRSLKVRHDNSASHKLAVQQHEASLRPPAPTPPVTPMKQLQKTPGLVKAINQPAHSAITYSCPFADCSLSFLDGGQLIVHMHSHGISMPMKEVQDQIVRNSTPTPTPREIPKETVKESVSEKSSQCPRCGAAFSAQGLLAHMKYCRFEIDTNDEPLYDVNAKLAGADPDLVCHICGKVCKNIRARQYHIDMWHTSKPSVVHKCTVCPRMFRSKFMLKRHNLSHGITFTKPTSYKCKLCKRTFHLPHNLQSHLKKHFQLGRSPSVVCPKCLKIFPSQDEYNTHRSIGCSIKVKIFSCNLCENSYNSQKSLDEHVAVHHPPPVESYSQADDASESHVICNICNKRYSTIANLKRHMLLHEPDPNSSARTFNCNVCLMGFPNIVTRDTHECIGAPGMSEPVKEILYEQPPPVTIRRRSRSVDSDGTLFACRHCSKPFTLLKSLHNHIKRYCRVRNAKCVFCGHIRNTRKPEALCRRCRKSQFIILEGDTRKVEKIRDASKKVYAEAKNMVPDMEPLPEEEFNEIEKPAENVMFKCPVGNKTFLTERSLNAHIPDCQGTCKDQAVYCKKCRKSYENPLVYIEHKPCKVRRKQKKNNARCHLCPRVYSSRKSLSAHLNKFHRYSIRGGFFEDAADEDADDTPRINVSRRKTKVEPVEEDISEDLPAIDEDIPVEAASDVSQLDYSNHFMDHDSNLLENSPLVSSHNAFELVSKEDRNCPACDIEFQTPLGLRRHINCLHRNKFVLVACPFCDRKTYKRELYEHGYQCIISNLPTAGSLECAFCGVMFNVDDDEEAISSKLQSHILSCGGKLPFKNGENTDRRNAVMCFKCCHLFAEVGHMRKHMTMRHGVRRSKVPLAAEENPASPSLSEQMSNPGQINMDVFSEVSCASGSSGSESVKKNKAVAKKRTAPPAAVAAEQGNLKCKFCNRSFFSLLKLVNHEKVHGIVQKNVSMEGETYELEVTEISAD